MVEWPLLFQSGHLTSIVKRPGMTNDEMPPFSSS